MNPVLLHRCNACGESYPDLDEATLCCPNITKYYRCSKCACQFSSIIDAAKCCASATPAASPEGFVQSPNCIGGCQSLYAGMCGPCYRLNRMKPVARVSDFMAHKRKKDDL